MSKSFVSLVRKTLGYKGQSGHTGRGCYELVFENVTNWEEMKGRVQKLIDKLTKEGTLESTETYKKEHWSKEGKMYEFLEVKVSNEVYGYYSHLIVNELDLGGYVCFKLDSKLFPMESP